MQQYLALFRNRNFLFHWSAGAISNLGDFFISLALVKLLSQDPDRLGFYMALVMVAKVAPTALLSPVAGVLADRFSRQRIMIISDVARALFVLGLVFVEQPAYIIGLCFLSAISAAFFGPASSALLPSLVSKEELVTASSLNVMTQRLAMLLGNGIGAVVLMAVGAHNVFLIDAATYALSGLLLLGLRLPAAAVQVQPATAQGGSPWRKFWTDMGEVLGFIRATPPIRHLVSVLAIIAVGDSATNVLLVTFFTVGLGLAAESLGFVWAIFGGAAVVGALGLGAIGRKVPWESLLSYGGAYIWFTVMGMLVAASPLPSITFLALLGLGSGAVNVGIQAAVGRLVPSEVRGRLFGAISMVNSLIYVVGILTAGFLSDQFGPGPTMMGFTTFYLAGGVYAFFVFRRKRSGLATEVEAHAG